MQQTLPLDAITLDPALQPRVGGLDSDHVHTLQGVPESWPPLVVVQQGRRYLLVDGFHRFAAAQNLSLASITVDVMDAPADGDLHALAFALNAIHGRPLSLTDRRTFAQRLLHQHPDWADREIGRRAGLSSNTVGTIREDLESTAQIEQPATRLGAGGHVYMVGTNPKQRPLGEMPDPVPSLDGGIIGRLFTPADRIRQRKIAHYLSRPKP